MNINARTAVLLSQLAGLDWFDNVGNRIHAGHDIIEVSSWEEALDICRSQPSEDARLESQNELTVRIFKAGGEGLSRWNDKVAELRPRIADLVERKLMEPSIRRRIPQDALAELLAPLRWNALGLCMACEYGELGNTQYYELLRYWLFDGRLPCGWVGEVPDDMQGAFEIGKMAIF